MNPELLKKCLSGEANSAEMEAFHQWMAGAPEDVPEHSIPCEAATGERLWHQIRRRNAITDSRRAARKILAFSAVAASILLLCLLAFLFVETDTPGNRFAEFRHHHEPSFREKNFHGLQVKLGAESNVRLEKRDGNRIDIRFEGCLLVSNTSAEDQYTAISYCQPNGIAATRKILLRKGKSCLLAYYPYKSDNLLVMDNRSLTDLPPAMAMNVNRDFIRL
ncbi:hypothetical protein [Chitinophaga solisilvae]|uniref:hypothetical protein n=1 Tax=Chitinophaga solisilvae TaxID=1233460 RepID=UPI00136C3672|nr:hypothetical protein [Chitinophaga solisilvae]